MPRPAIFLADGPNGSKATNGSTGSPPAAPAEAARPRRGPYELEYAISGGYVTERTIILP